MRISKIFTWIIRNRPCLIRCLMIILSKIIGCVLMGIGIILAGINTINKPEIK